MRCINILLSFAFLAGCSSEPGGRQGDPLAAEQWHLHNTGQLAYSDTPGTAGEDLRAETTYRSGLRGLGVKVAVVDSGLEIGHEDLAANLVPGSWNFTNSTPDPSPAQDAGDHGTSVAGIIAMVADNGIGGVGVAPRASLNGYNLLESESFANQVASLGGSTESPASADVWIFNQSYGVDSDMPVSLNPVIEEVFAYGVASLRQGRGAIYVKAAGNGFTEMQGEDGSADCAFAQQLGVSCQNASMDPEAALPYNIVVGAFGAGGVKSSYSTAGSSLWVSAPGGEYGWNAEVQPDQPAYFYQPAIITTDQTGCQRGYSQSSATTSRFDRGGSPNPSCNYTNCFNGTSAATPAASGAIALLLEARPDLTWREVKHVLAATSRRIDPDRPATTVTEVSDGPYVAELPWIVNAAGFHFHNWYGFGAVDVDAAVELARSHGFSDLGVFTNSGWIASESLSLAIPDASALGAISSLTSPDLVVEAVQIQVSINHGVPADLAVELESPSHTRSILLNVANAFKPGAVLDHLLLESNAFYGEPSGGTWTLRVVDAREGNTGTLTEWQLRVFGH